MGGVPPLRFLDGSILGNGASLKLYSRSLSALLSAHFSFVPTLHRGGPLVLGVLSYPLLFSPPLRDHLTFLQILYWPFLLQVRIGVQSEVAKEGGRGEE